jgi:hypothetical protein
MENGKRSYSGILVECPEHSVNREDLLGCRGLVYSDSVAGRWERFRYESKAPLVAEDKFGKGPPYRYSVLVRRSGTRFLLLSNHKQVAEHVVKNLQPLFRPKLRNVMIGVDQLVKSLTQKPTTYVLSFAHAKVPAFGAVLRSISFYGEDLAEASLFRQHLGLMVFHTCGLRDARGGVEILQLGSDGSVSFYLSRPKKVFEVEEVLRYLRKAGYLAPEIIEPSAVEK